MVEMLRVTPAACAGTVTARTEGHVDVLAGHDHDHVVEEAEADEGQAVDEEDQSQRVVGQRALLDGCTFYLVRAKRMCTHPARRLSSG